MTEGGNVERWSGESTNKRDTGRKLAAVMKLSQGDLGEVELWLKARISSVAEDKNHHVVLGGRLMEVSHL